MLSPENRVGSWLGNSTLEILPNTTSRHLLNSTSAETDYSVTNLPAESIATTMNFAVELAEEGMNVAPHIASSRISRKQALEVGTVLGDNSLDHIFVMNGDSNSSSATYSSSLDLLEDLHDHGVALNKIGVVGHPEEHPVVPRDKLDQALKDKQALAQQTGAEMYIVTQMCFDPSAVIRWIRNARQTDIHLPVRVGLPGPIAVDKLETYSGICGVGGSIRLLRSNRKDIFDPHDFLAEIASEAVDRDGIEGVYFFTFNEPRKTQEWVGRAIS